MSLGERLINLGPTIIDEDDYDEESEDESEGSEVGKDVGSQWSGIEAIGELKYIISLYELSKFHLLRSNRNIY